MHVHCSHGFSTPTMSMTSRQRMSYDAAILFWRVIVQIFFREITSRGGSNIPREGPIIFVGGPHNNQVSPY